MLSLNLKPNIFFVLLIFIAVGLTGSNLNAKKLAGTPIRIAFENKTDQTLVIKIISTGTYPGAEPYERYSEKIEGNSNLVFSDEIRNLFKNGLVGASHKCKVFNASDVELYEVDKNDLVGDVTVELNENGYNKRS